MLRVCLSFAFMLTLSACSIQEAQDAANVPKPQVNTAKENIFGLYRPAGRGPEMRSCVAEGRAPIGAEPSLHCETCAQCERADGRADRF